VSAAGAERQAAGEVRAALEQQVEQLRQAHQAQLAALRDELDAANVIAGDIKEYDLIVLYCCIAFLLTFSLFSYSQNQKLSLAQQQLQLDYDKLKLEEADKSAKLQELMSVVAKVSSFEKLESFEGLNERDNRYVLRQIRKLGELDAIALNKKRKDLANFEVVNLKRDSVEAKKEKPLCSSIASFTHCHIHPLHIHLLISVTMILITHRCPHIIIMV
jgi:multidrug efflux pump subunit AcrA (membrane-fusion protein)